MKDNSVLFEIKALEQEIFRFIFYNIKIPDKRKIPTPTQMQIVGYILKHNNHDIYQRDLENVLQLRRATVSGVLGTMEKNKLIKRIIDKNDMRTKQIILNPEMEIFLKKHLKEMDKFEDVLIKDISKEEIKVFIKVIKQMKQNIEYTNK